MSLDPALHSQLQNPAIKFTNAIRSANRTGAIRAREAAYHAYHAHHPRPLLPPHHASRAAVALALLCLALRLLIAGPRWEDFVIAAAMAGGWAGVLGVVVLITSDAKEIAVFWGLVGVAVAVLKKRSTATADPGAVDRYLVGVVLEVCVKNGDGVTQLIARATGLQQFPLAAGWNIDNPPPATAQESTPAVSPRTTSEPIYDCAVALNIVLNAPGTDSPQRQIRTELRSPCPGLEPLRPPAGGKEREEWVAERTVMAGAGGGPPGIKATPSTNDRGSSEERNRVRVIHGPPGGAPVTPVRVLDMEDEEDLYTAPEAKMWLQARKEIMEAEAREKAKAAESRPEGENSNVSAGENTNEGAESKGEDTEDDGNSNGDSAAAIESGDESNDDDASKDRDYEDGPSSGESTEEEFDAAATESEDNDSDDAAEESDAEESDRPAEDEEQGSEDKYPEPTVIEIEDDDDKEPTVINIENGDEDEGSAAVIETKDDEEEEEVVEQKPKPKKKRR